jgi:hypothetical protein
MEGVPHTSTVVSYSNLVWQCVFELAGSALAGAREYPPLLTTNGKTMRAKIPPGTWAISTRSKSRDTLKTRAVGLEAASTKS